MAASIYYIRKNATAQLPANILILDTETHGTPAPGNVEIHRMYLAWTWRMYIDDSGEITREAWHRWQDCKSLGEYVTQEARSKAPLYVIGSNITFDLFACGLLEYLDNGGWTCDTLYDKGLVTILIAVKDNRKLKICAAQNWLQGGVKAWGELIGLTKGEVNFETDDFETVSEYCHLDVEITGKAFIDYMAFVRSHDMGGFALTASGQAFRCFRHRFMKPRSILHYDQTAYNSFTRAAYFGGRVEAGYIGRLTGDYVKLDINSMYPHVMRNNVYPAKVKQWIRDPSLESCASKVSTLCGVAEVEIDTNEPAYPIRKDGRLVFPTGKFATFLCTESLRYALANGHLTKVRQLLTFTPMEMFTEYVDYFYPLKSQYKKEGNGVWEKTTKLMLNGLYGKFGEKRSHEVHREYIPGVAVERTPGLFDKTPLQKEPPKFDWRYDPSEHEDSPMVRGVTWSMLGTKVTEVGDEEGSGSAPAIAAHVTDYARMLLYRFMLMVGLDNVLYADTDSLIIHEHDLSKLTGVIDNETLGSLKIEGRANSLEIRGAKDYSFGGDLRRKGIRSSAIAVCRQCRAAVDADSRQCGECGDYLRTPCFQQAYFPGFYSLLRRGIMGSFPVGIVTKALTGTYTKGEVMADGRVQPLNVGHQPAETAP